MLLLHYALHTYNKQVFLTSAISEGVESKLCPVCTVVRATMTTLQNRAAFQTWVLGRRGGG